MTLNARNLLMGSTALCLAAATMGTAEAKITKIEITRVESPTFEGRSFGTVGQYEKLVGRAYGEVDPKDKRNAVIVDIQNAPKNANGMVEYDTDIYILKPINMANSNHRLWFEVNKRGNMPAYALMTEGRVQANNPTKAADAGHGFLMNQCYTIVEACWDATASTGGGRFTIHVPVAKNANGSPIVGPSLEEFVVDDDQTTEGDLTYTAASVDKSKATLTVRTRYEDKPEVVPADKWTFDEKGESINLLPEGTAFKKGSLYEFTYLAKDP